MLLRMVKEHAGRKHYRARGKLLELGKEAVELPDDVATRAMEENPGVFEAVRARGAVDTRELKRG